MNTGLCITHSQKVHWVVLTSRPQQSPLSKLHSNVLASSWHTPSPTKFSKRQNRGAVVIVLVDPPGTDTVPPSPPPPKMKKKIGIFIMQFITDTANTHL